MEERGEALAGTWANCDFGFLISKNGMETQCRLSAGMARQAHQINTLFMRS